MNAEDYALAFPGVQFAPESFEVLAAEDADERRRFLAEVGEEALRQAPIAQQLAALANKVDQLLPRQARAAQRCPGRSRGPC
jgi:hypothetical protein